VPRQKCQVREERQCQLVDRQVTSQVAQQKCQDRQEDVCVLVPVPKCTIVKEKVEKKVRTSSSLLFL
jgi:hypothetical protein